MDEARSTGDSASGVFAKGASAAATIKVKVAAGCKHVRDARVTSGTGLSNWSIR
jgi:hypothetical protein